MNSDQQAKQQAADQQAIGQGLVSAHPRRPESRELRIEALDGGFIVGSLDSWHNVERRVIPNADCLLSFVQKWVGEGQQTE